MGFKEEHGTLGSPVAVFRGGVLCGSCHSLMVEIAADWEEQWLNWEEQLTERTKMWHNIWVPPILPHFPITPDLVHVGEASAVIGQNVLKTNGGVAKFSWSYIWRASIFYCFILFFYLTWVSLPKLALALLVTSENAMAERAQLRDGLKHSTAGQGISSGGLFGPMGQASEASTTASVQRSAWGDDKVDIVVITWEGPSPIVSAWTILYEERFLSRMCHSQRSHSRCQKWDVKTERLKEWVGVKSVWLYRKEKWDTSNETWWHALPILLFTKWFKRWPPSSSQSVQGRVSIPDGANPWISGLAFQESLLNEFLA